jgi:hypothetical protein
LINNLIMVSCITADFEKQIVFLVNRFIRVRRFKFLRSFFRVFCLPILCLVVSCGALVGTPAIAIQISCSHKITIRPFQLLRSLPVECHDLCCGQCINYRVYLGEDSLFFSTPMTVFLLIPNPQSGIMNKLSSSTGFRKVIAAAFRTEYFLIRRHRVYNAASYRINPVSFF